MKLWPGACPGAYLPTVQIHQFQRLRMAVDGYRQPNASVSMGGWRRLLTVSISGRQSLAARGAQFTRGKQSPATTTGPTAPKHPRARRSRLRPRPRSRSCRRAPSWRCWKRPVPCLRESNGRGSWVGEGADVHVAGLQAVCMPLESVQHSLNNARFVETLSNSLVRCSSCQCGLVHAEIRSLSPITLFWSQDLH